MKRIKLFLGITLIALMGVFTSCEEDEGTATIEINKVTMPESLEVGKSYTLEFSIFTDENIESIELRQGTSTLKEKIEDFREKTADTFTYTDSIVDSSKAGTTLDYSLIVTDKKANEKSYDFSLTVKSLGSDDGDGDDTTSVEVTTYTSKTLEVALADGTAEDLFSVMNGKVYTYNYLETNSKKDSADIMFGHSGLLKALDFKLMSPDITTSVDIHNGGSLPNSTVFNVVTDITFADITGDDIKNIADLTNNEVTITAGDVVAFITEAGHKGYIKINTLDAAGGDADDYVTFDMKFASASELNQ